MSRKEKSNQVFYHFQHWKENNSSGNTILLCDLKVGPEWNLHTHAVYPGNRSLSLMIYHVRQSTTLTLLLSIPSYPSVGLLTFGGIPRLSKSKSIKTTEAHILGAPGWHRGGSHSYLFQKIKINTPLSLLHNNACFIKKFENLYNQWKQINLSLLYHELTAVTTLMQISVFFPKHIHFHFFEVSL